MARAQLERPDLRAGVRCDSDFWGRRQPDPDPVAALHVEADALLGEVRDLMRELADAGSHRSSTVSLH